MSHSCSYFLEGPRSELTNQTNWCREIYRQQTRASGEKKIRIVKGTSKKKITHTHTNARTPIHTGTQDAHKNQYNHVNIHSYKHPTKDKKVLIVKPHLLKKTIRKL